MKKIGFMALSMLTLVVSAYADKSINQDVTPGSFTKGYTLDANGIYHVTVTAIDGWSFDGDSTVSGSGWIPEGTHGAKLNKKYSFNDPALETVTLRGFLKKNETGSGGDRPKYTADFVAKKYYIVATDPEKAKNEDEIYILSTETGTIQSYENKTLVPSDWTFTPTLEGKMVTVGGKNTVTVGAGGDVTEPGIYKVVAKYKSQQDDIDLGIIEVKLKSVDFTGDKNYIMKKTSTATYYIDDKYASDGPVTIAYPELRLDKEGKQIEQLEPACYKMLAVPATAIVLYVKPDLSIHPISARIQIINNGSPCCEGEVSLNSSEATTGNLLWDSSYASVNVNKTYETCEWKIHLEGRSKFTSLGDRKKCTLFSVYAAPRGSSPTSVRIELCVRLAKDTTTPGAIADKLGPDATAKKRFKYNGKSIGSGLKDWEILDGTLADCISLSSLMKSELEIIGVTGAELRCICACSYDSNWATLMSSYPDVKYEHRVPGDKRTRLIFNIGGGRNNFEGCCYFNYGYYKKYWPGGVGQSFPWASNVFFAIVPRKGFQFWADDGKMEHVAWPITPPPQY